MKKTLLKSVSMLLVLVCIISTLGVYSSAEAAEIEPRFAGIASLAASLDISSSGCASCYGRVTPYSGYKVTLKVALQRDGKTIKSWSDTDNETFSIDEIYYVTPGHDYQVVVTATVYNSSGKIVETPTADSAVVSY